MKVARNSEVVEILGISGWLNHPFFGFVEILTGHIPIKKLLKSPLAISDISP